MNLSNIFKKKSLKDNKTFTIDDTGVIPYNEIKDLKNVTFVVITKNETVLEKVIRSIMEFQKGHKDMEINVVLSSSYQMLNELSGGAF